VTQIDNRVMIKGTTGSIKPDAATNTVVYSLTDKLGDGILVRTSHGIPNLAQTYVVVGIVKRSTATGAPEIIEEQRYAPKTPMGQPEPDYVPNVPTAPAQTSKEPAEEQKSGIPDWALYAAGALFIVLAIALGAVLAVRSNREKQRQWEEQGRKLEEERRRAQEILRQGPVPSTPGGTLAAVPTGGAGPGGAAGGHRPTLQAWGTLEVFEGPDRGKTFPLAGNRVIIGREEGDVRLSADSAVSGRHATLSRTNDGRLLYIDSSTNGSVVEGKPVHHGQAEVHDGTEIQAGVSKFRLHVIALPAPSAAAPERVVAAPTVFVEPASAATQMFTGCEVAVLSGQKAGQTFPLAQAEVTIGREGTDMLLPDASVSRKHASLSLRRGDYVLKNLSKWGTKVNGEDVDEHTLQAGDKIQMGEVTLEFRRVG